jgi:C1A family cysteine protease
MALIIMKPNMILPSRLFLYYKERVVDSSGSLSDSGASAADGLNALIQYGVCSEKCWPYIPSNCNVRPPALCDGEADSNKVHQIGVLDMGNPNLVDSMINTLASGIPIMLGIQIYTNFQENRDGNVGMPSGKYLGGHEILVIGYTSQIFLCINSWGSSWGNGGFCTIPQSYVKISSFIYSLVCLVQV